MNIIDITRTAQNAPIYPGSSPIIIEQVCDMQKGDAFNASMIHAGSHMGTHADAHCHFIKDSTRTIEDAELYRYYGPCRVVTVPEKQMITRADLEGKIENCERLCIHGGGLSYLSPEAAQYIVACNILTVVIDAWSIAPLDNELEIHSIILGAQIAVVENVILDHVPDGTYTLCAFPVKYAGCDGAPVRAVLLS